ncbi:hypothetical protein OIO90_006446 [Microbotryomycetes sp. JL221]|nr:hypothetical protein OIO90_006446 [Microbotryomycetes sp. JL221]
MLVELDRIRVGDLASFFRSLTTPLHRQSAQVAAEYEWEQLRARQGGSRHLEFFDQDLQGVGGARIVLDALQKNPGATSMTLSQNRLGDNGLRELLMGLKQLRSQAEINLSNNGLTDVSLHLIALHLLQPSPHPPTITHLYLTHNSFELSDSDLAQFLGSALSSPQCSLQCLSLTNNQGIGSDGARALLSHIRLGPGSRLAQLHLSLCALGPSFAQDVATWLEDPEGGARLQILGLNANQLGTRGTTKIAKSVISGQASSLIHLECLANETETTEEDQNVADEQASSNLQDDLDLQIFEKGWRPLLETAQKRNKIVLRETRTAALANLAVGRVLFGGNARENVPDQERETGQFPFARLPVELRVHIFRCLIMLRPSLHAASYPKLLRQSSTIEANGSTRREDFTESLIGRASLHLSSPLTERQFLLLLEHCASSTTLATEARITNLYGKVPALKHANHHGYTNLQASADKQLGERSNAGPAEWDEWTSVDAEDSVRGQAERTEGTGYEEWVLRKTECDRFARG